MEKENDFLKLPKTKTFLWVLCGILVILVAFGLGLAVGYRRAIFASEFGAHYYRGMYGDPSGQPFIGLMGVGPTTVHGVSGEVIDVSSGTISVREVDGNEESVLVSSHTPIREMNNDISAQDIEPYDQIVVIGQPDANGEVEARFIRVFEASSSPPTTPSSISSPH